MKLLLAIVGLLGLATSVTAQFEQLASLPACASSCIISNIGVTSCPLTDTKCICNDPKLNDAVATCSLAKCSVRDGLTAKRVAAQQCGLKARDRGPQIIAISIACFGIVWVFYLTRIATRTILKVGVLGLDDLFMTLSVLITAVGLASTLLMAKHGLGRDIWAIDLDNFDALLLWFWIGELAYIWGTSFLKLSLLFFFMRIFSSTRLKKWIWIAIGIHVAFILAFTLAIVFQCTPINYAWRFWDGAHEGKCINVNAAGWSLAALTIVLDVLVLTLPIRELWKLKMSRTKKFYIMLMFGLGFVVTIISILRLQSLIKFSKTLNFTYDNFPTVYWSCFEGCFGLVALCLPTLRPFLGAVAPKLFSTVGSTAKSTTAGSRPSIFSRLTRRTGDRSAGSRQQPNSSSSESELPFSAVTYESTHTHETTETVRSEKKPTHTFDVA